jgi:hypothetical protein
MADNLWDQVKKKFDNAVTMGVYAADQWGSVVALHKSPAEAMKAIDRRAAELDAQRQANRKRY